MCAQIIFLFLAGAGLYRIRVLLPNFQGTWAASGGLLLFLIASLQLFNHAIALIYAAFAFLILGLSYEKGWLATVLSQRIFVYGGLISYSMYMTHAVVLKFANPVFQKIGTQTQELRIAEAAVFIVAVLITASSFYHLVEVPCNKLMRRNSPFGLDCRNQSRPSVLMSQIPPTKPIVTPE
jgi:peptidoglycan/LPS O-acetylase OafA/YrhL